MAVNVPGVFRARTPKQPITSPLGSALERAADRLASRWEKKETKTSQDDIRRGQFLYYQAQDAWYAWYNQLIAEGDIERMEPAEFNQATNQRIELFGATMADTHPHLREKFEANVRAESAPVMARMIQAKKTRQETEALGQLVEEEERIRNEMPHHLRVAANESLPHLEREAAFHAIQGLSDRHDMVTATVSEEERIKSRAKFDDWLNMERFEAWVGNHIERGTVGEASSRQRNYTDWVDNTDHERGRWSAGLTTDEIQTVFARAWVEQARVLEDRAVRREADAQDNEAIAKALYHETFDQLKKGEILWDAAEATLDRAGQTSEKWGSVQLQREWLAHVNTQNELREEQILSNPYLQGRQQVRLRNVEIMDQNELASFLENMRQEIDLPDEWFGEIKGAVTARSDYLDRLDREDAEQERHREKYIRLQRKGMYTNVGYLHEGATAIVPDPTLYRDISWLQMADAQIVEWIHRNEATEEQIEYIYQTYLPAIHTAWKVLNIPVGTYREVSEPPDPIEQEEQGQTFWEMVGGWFAGFGEGGEDVDVVVVAPPGGLTAGADATDFGGPPVQPLPNVTQALEVMAREHGMDTDQEFLMSLPLGHVKPYLRWAEDGSGAIDRVETLELLGDAPNIGPARAAMIWDIVLEPFLRSAIAVRGWNSGVDRAQAQQAWMKAKRLP